MRLSRGRGWRSRVSAAPRSDASGIGFPPAQIHALALGENLPHCAVSLTTALPRGSRGGASAPKISGVAVAAGACLVGGRSAAPVRSPQLPYKMECFAQFRGSTCSVFKASKPRSYANTRILYNFVAYTAAGTKCLALLLPRSRFGGSACALAVSLCLERFAETVPTASVKPMPWERLISLCIL